MPSIIHSILPPRPPTSDLTKFDPELHANTAILKLPKDVFQAIANTMPPADAIALAHTCKAAYNTIPKEAQRLRTKEDLAAYSQQIERHYPNKIACFECGTLHRRIDVCGGDDVYHPCALNNPVFEGCTLHHQLRFVNVQEVMNAHHYGLKNGVPPHAIGFTSGELYMRTMPEILSQAMVRTRMKYPTEDGEVRISNDDQLLFKTKQSYVFGQDDHAPVDNFCLNPRFCPHSGHASPDEFLAAPEDEEYRRCPLCGSEARLRVTIKPKDDYSLGRIELTTWHNLGHGRTPSDPQWLSITQHGPAAQIETIPEHDTLYRKQFKTATVSLPPSPSGSPREISGEARRTIQSRKKRDSKKAGTSMDFRWLDVRFTITRKIDHDVDDYRL